MRSNATVCSVFESSNGGVTKAVDKRPDYLRCPFSVVILYWLRYVELGTDQCPLFGVERCPLLGGSKCISSMVKSIGGKRAVRCTEVVRFSEGPLLGVLLYIYLSHILHYY